MERAHGYVSIAIWHGNKIVLAFALGVWVTNVSFLIQGKSLPVFPDVDGPEISYICDLVSGIVRVNNEH